MFCAVAAAAQVSSTDSCLTLPTTGNTVSTVVYGVVRAAAPDKHLPSDYADTIAAAIGSRLRITRTLAIPVFAVLDTVAIPAVRGAVVLRLDREGRLGQPSLLVSSLDPNLDAALLKAATEAAADPATPRYTGVNPDSAGPILFALAAGPDAAQGDGGAALLHTSLPEYRLDQRVHVPAWGFSPQLPDNVKPPATGDTVGLEFAVGPDGQMVRQTALLTHGRYEDYVVASMGSVTKTRFMPARIHGCPVPQIVRRQYHFPLYLPGSARSSGLSDAAPVALPRFDSAHGELPAIRLGWEGRCGPDDLPRALVRPVGAAATSPSSDMSAYLSRVKGSIDEQTQDVLSTWEMTWLGLPNRPDPEVAIVSVLPGGSLGTVAVERSPFDTVFLRPMLLAVLRSADSAHGFESLHLKDSRDTLHLRISWGLDSTGAPFVSSSRLCSASMAPHSAHPTYPVDLRQRGIMGYVRVRFVIDTTGLAIPSSLQIVKASSPGFADAVREALPGMRFIPATLDGRPIREMVRQSFRFNINRQ